MKRIALSVVLFTVLMVSILSGCAFIKQKVPKESSAKELYMLNDRQKAILEQEGLPTKYEELPLSKKIAIEAIEDMFKYLDVQYPEDDFIYIGYIPQTSLEKEQLLVNCQYGKVTVYRDISEKKNVFTDNYYEMKASDIYATEIDNLLSGISNDNDYIVSVFVNKFDGVFADVSMVDHCMANVTIFVNEDLGEEKFKDITFRISKYLSEKAKKQSVSADVYLVKKSDFDIDLPTRYKENIDIKIFLKQTSFYHRKNGEEKLYEVER